ncbi:MAG TPA: 2OG-Fe(II) oxygenase [Trebonia sp.]|nr:2OG-Fe(II) oxygenase [Trebonia sp.]
MGTAARDRLARMLHGDVQSAFSVELTARPDDLGLEVEGFGPVKFPVTPAKARKLIGLGEPARFGRGEETVTDPEVRDTWEIPRNLVRATWNPAMLDVILKTIKEELGLPHGAELTAGLHSLLVYEPNQFFLAHQDSEKDDAMVGTLVVTLPSNYRGGELMVGHNEEWKAHRGSATALSLVAFYADCQHEVLRVQSGYRITLTYNLLMHGDTSRPEGEEGKLAELSALLREHFATLAPRYAYGEPTDLPNRLVYLLDHEYTPRALGWTRLKGADAIRASLLRTAAERAGYEAVLALADVKTSHSAFPEDEYGYRRRRWYDDEEDEEYDGRTGTAGRKFEIQELIDSEVTLTHWTGPDGRRLEQTSLAVRNGEVCASTENGDLVPYSSEYEGYMGNWGNTLDRWYHRAAVAVWPRAQAFANRAENSPAWALGELAAMAAAGDTPGAREAASTLRPFWESAVHGLTSAEKGPASEFAGKALRTAAAVEDRETAAMLLRPFRVENLAEGQAGPLAAIAVSYGQEWTTDLLRAWFGGGQPAWAYTGTERQHWVSSRLRGLCEALDAAGDGAGVTARLLLDLSWAWLRKDIDETMGLSSPRTRDRVLGDLAKPLAAVLTTAAALGSVSVRDAISEHLMKQNDSVTVLELSTLRTVTAAPGTELPAAGAPGDAGFRDLAADCAARLRARADAPGREDGDWSISLPPGGCTCELCATLAAFLSDARRRTFEWPLAKPRRQHIHGRIDNAEIPVTHVTRRQGSPYTLVLTKTDALFADDRSARDAAAADLEWLTGQWNLPG